ncbi:MAG: DNA polymerase [bacterium]
MKQEKASNIKTIVILDAHAIIHRAYHALPSFTKSDGTPTGAIYGTASMVLRMIELIRPDYVVAAYDLPKPTFRHHAYDAYKAGRAKTDDNLILQIQATRTLMDAFGIECIDAPGFEADDVIGTIVEQYKDDASVHIVIASGDMDTLQLVSGIKTQVFTLKKGIHDSVFYDEKAVLARYMFSPLQIPDYKGLRGDPSDNIIGVPGIGEKTATELLVHFKTIEGIYEALEKDKELLYAKGFSKRIVELLDTHKDDAFFSKTLATIRRDAPIQFSIPEQSIYHVDFEKLTQFFDAYEFRSLLPKVKSVFAIEEKKEEIIAGDPELVRKAAIGLWVLYSEYTNADEATIYARTKKNSLSEAISFIEQELQKRGLFDLYEKMELPLVPIITEMEQYGIAVDLPYLQQCAKELRVKLDSIEKEIEDIAGSKINLNSPKQLSALLFETLEIKPKGKRKASGAYTTNADVLDELSDSHPIIPLILKYREMQKVFSTYIEALPHHIREDGRIHATFLQHGTTTGRFSSTNPNMQNLPASEEFGKEVRRAFVASPEHVFIGSDYSQIELRVLAMLSLDKTLQKSFADGMDIHTVVASRVFGVSESEVTKDMRRKAKVINFGIIYGMGISALQKNLGVSRAEATTFYEQYFAAFPTIKEYLDSIKGGATEKGYTETAFGRRRYFPMLQSNAPYMRSFAERMATNAPIQGTAADIIKLAILAVDAELTKHSLKEKVHLLLQIHDELVYEVHTSVQEQAAAIIQNTMVEVLKNPLLPYTGENVVLAVSVATGTSLDQLK